MGMGNNVNNAGINIGNLGGGLMQNMGNTGGLV